MQEDLYQLYLDEIEQISPCTRRENALLAVRLAKGDQEAKKRMVEGNLKAVLAYVGEYRDRGVTLSDLVQEANVALLLSVESYAALASSVMAEREATELTAAEGAFEQYLEQKLREALEAALEEEAKEDKVEEEILSRVNVLKEVSKQMAEELGREASVEELADRMGMAQEEIKEILRLTLEAFSVTEEDEERTETDY